MGVSTLSPSVDQKALSDFLVQVYANGSETASPTPPKKEDRLNKREQWVLWLEEIIAYTWKGEESKLHGAELNPQTLV